MGSPVDRMASSADADARRARVAEFVGRSDKKLQDDDATSHWATQHLPEHSELVERAKATVNAGHQREAEDRTKFDELYGIKMVIDVNDKERINKLRERYTSQKHHFANLRDTRDLMERDGPLLENRVKDHYIATQAFMHTAMDRQMEHSEEARMASLAPPPAYPITSSVGVGIPDFRAVAGPITSARGLNEARFTAQQMNNNEWGQQLGADQSWLMTYGH